MARYNKHSFKADGKIRNKNYYLLKRGERKNAKLDGQNLKIIKKKENFYDDENEREELQKVISEQLPLVVEENKKKSFIINNENKKINDANEGDVKANVGEGVINENINAIETREKIKSQRNNLTVIEKNVLTDKEFKSLPISRKTLKALEENGFTVMTNIQAVSIPIVLLNKHIYAQAQTGTGKTLCFGIPLIEKLYRNGANNQNHILEGVIISPTRELVFQIFEVLNMLNKYHKLNICCVIGGKNEEKEKGVFSYANIVVCTPGRLLYHLENNYFCNLDYVHTFVIDEIDKLVDSSFYNNLQNILLYKPQEDCQVCLFSATMCKYLNVILKTFNIKNYEYVSINDKDTYIESNLIKHIFIECSLYEKINNLYTFLFSKREKKIMVFFSTCKQVRFMFEIFKKIKVGVMKFLQLHGKLKQTSRLNTYALFSQKKNHTCLFTTDIGCRGLDFSNVNWVIHFDVPENVETFIHRSGRTGRFTKEGNSLIFLTKEVDNRKIFLNILKDNNIEIKEKNIKQNKMFDISSKIHSINAAFTEIKHLAKTALVNYLRHLRIVMKFKNVNKLDLDKLADSYGLVQFSEEMKRELGYDGEDNQMHRKKRSRFQKFLENLKEQKRKKKEEMEKEKEKEKEIEITEETCTNIGIKKEKKKNQDDTNKRSNDCELEEENRKQFETYNKKKKTDGCEEAEMKENDNNDDENDDSFFHKRKVKIKGESLALMPKKRKKRVKVAGVLSNSVLYDDEFNEITGETQKIKFLLKDVENKSEEKEKENEEAYREETLEEMKYLQSLKKEIEESNKKMKHEMSVDGTDDGNDSEDDEQYSTKEEESDEYSENIKKRKLKKKIQKKKIALKKKKMRDENEDSIKYADITELENEALAYLK